MCQFMLHLVQQSIGDIFFLFIVIFISSVLEIVKHASFIFSKQNFVWCRMTYYYDGMSSNESNQKLWLCFDLGGKTEWFCSIVIHVVHSF